MKDFAEGYSKEELLENSQPIIKNNNGHYLYFLFDGDEIVYVGQTTVLSARIAHHQTDKDFDRYAYFPIDASYADEEETFYILKFTPKYNKMISSFVDYKTATQVKKERGINEWAMKRLIKEKNPRVKRVGRKTYLRVEDLI